MITPYFRTGGVTRNDYGISPRSAAVSPNLI